MSLLEEDLPGVSKVCTDFQLREDKSLAHRLQEQEFEDHFNSNVQLRRTARHDVSFAKAEQDKEHREEMTRLKHLRDREQRDREHAEEVAMKLEEEERKLKDREQCDWEHAAKVAQMIEEEERANRERELIDQEHAAKIAKKMKDEEEIQMALRMQDEIMAKKMHEVEAKRLAKMRLQEETDGRMARQTSIEEREKLKQRRKPEKALSEREIQRMKQLQLQRGAHTGSPKSSPQTSLPPATRRSNHHQDRLVTSLPPGKILPNGSHKSAVRENATPSSDELPSYDDCVPNSRGLPVGEEEMDENERLALQEEEDERIAREIIQKEEDERKRREEEDMVFARRMQEEEEKKGKRKAPTSHSQDLELARKLHQEEKERAMSSQPNHERDMELARQLYQQELDRSKKKPTKSTLNRQESDAEYAMRLQQEEMMKQKELKKQMELKKQKLAQQRILEAQAMEYLQMKEQHQLRQQQNGSVRSPAQQVQEIPKPQGLAKPAYKRSPESSKKKK